MNNKRDFIDGIASKLVNNEQLTPIETQAVISALRESNNCLQKPYYEVIYHDEYDNTEHRIMEPVYSKIVDTMGIGDNRKIQEDCFDLRFRRIVKEEEHAE